MRIIKAPKSTLFINTTKTIAKTNTTTVSFYGEKKKEAPQRSIASRVEAVHQMHT